MTRRDEQRLHDILAAIDAHRYYDLSRAIVQATVDRDLPELAAAAHRLLRRLGPA